MEADYLKYFESVENSIRNNDILTIKKLSCKINKNYHFSRLVLYEFFMSRKSLDNLITIFFIVINDNNCLRNILIPSYSEVLNSVLNNFELLEFYVYAIFKKDSNFDFKDLTAFIEPNDIQINFINDGTAFSEPSKVVPSDKETTSLTNIGNINNSNVSSVIKEDPQSKTIKPILKTKDKIPSSSVAKQTQEKITFPTGSSQQNNKAKTCISKSNLNNEEMESLENKEKVLSSFENNFKLDEENHDQEEEFFYGGRVATNSKSQEEGVSVPKKRKASPNPEEKNEKRKKEVPKTKQEYSDIETENNNNTSHIEKNKVKKIRKVKKTTYATDEKGYLHSIDEYVDEEYWSDELKQPPKKVPIVDDKKTKGKKNNSGQGNLLNFFAKK